MSVPAHEVVRTADCRIVGCTNEAPARGRYARLCSEHRMKLATTSGPAAPPPNGQARTPAPAPVPAPAPAAEQLSIKSAAERLNAAAADLDESLERRHAAREDAKRALAAFKAALEDIHQAAKDAVA